MMLLFLIQKSPFSTNQKSGKFMFSVCDFRGWSIISWKWNKDWVIDLNLKFWLPSRVSTLNTNFTSHQFNIILEISLSGIRIFEAKNCFSEKKRRRNKILPKIESETTKNKFPKVVSEISERLFDFRIRNMDAEEINS